jgi:hypothetical protein
MPVSKDTLAGLLFVAIGLGAVVIASTYDLGSARAMGPGYFPLVLGALIALFGGILVVQSFLGPGGERVTAFAVRPTLFIVASIVAFAFLVRPAGLIPAIAAVVVLGRLADTRIRVGESLLMAAVIALVCTVLFVFLLKMPLRVLP